MWHIVDRITTVIFALEIILKVIGYGLYYNGKRSFLRSYSNWLDLIVVISALTGWFLTEWSGLLSKFKIFRIVRIMRPLRIISKSEQLKITIESFNKSIPQMFSLFIISFLSYFVFGVFGIQNYKGWYWKCVMDHVDEDQIQFITDKY